MNHDTYPVTVIKPSKSFSAEKLIKLWEYRELLYFFIWRDIKVRYKQTIIGAVWAIIQPLMAMLVFTLFFGRLAKIPSDNIPYPIFSYAALVPWLFFANGLTNCTESLVSSAELIKKVYFPRLTIPLSAVLSGSVDFILAFIVLLLMMPIFGLTPGINIIWLPFFILLAFITCLGTGLWFTTMNVLFRDIRYATPFLIQLWLFASPVVYPSSLLSEPWRTLYGINPMVGVIEGFRWSLLGVTESAPGSMLIVSTLVSLLILFSGIYFFGRMEKKFADVI
jgi:homopolymeric O-antigen transport system permease protein